MADCIGSAKREGAFGHRRPCRAGGGMVMYPAAALAQGATENAVASADDAFGARLVGVYRDLHRDRCQGLQSASRGNARLDASISISWAFWRKDWCQVRPFAWALPRSITLSAPTGIVDYHLRASGNELSASTAVYLLDYGERAAQSTC